VNHKNKIAAVVTIFNPDEKIKVRLDSIFPFVEKLYIVDNSDQENKHISKYQQEKVEYIFNGENLGIAYAMNLGIEKAQSDGFNFLLTLDQDSEFDINSLENLILSIQSDDKVAIYSPFHKNKFFTNLPSNDQYEEVFDVMSSGNILNLEITKLVGLFREDYFIDYVDTEYCLRLRKNGYKIIRVNSSILNHNEANLMRKSFWGKYVYPPNHKPFRWYYKIRNFFYLRAQYRSDFPEYFLKEQRNIINNIIKLILFEPDKILKLRFIIKGFIDYKKNVKGKLK
jgi:rhamnosyltransferase